MKKVWRCDMVAYCLFSIRMNLSSASSNTNNNDKKFKSNTRDLPQNLIQDHLHWLPSFWYKGRCADKMKILSCKCYECFLSPCLSHLTNCCFLKSFSEVIEIETKVVKRRCRVIAWLIDSLVLFQLRKRSFEEALRKSSQGDSKFNQWATSHLLVCSGLQHDTVMKGREEEG